MPYRICDLDVTAPLPDLVLGPSETGIGLVVRRGGVPVGFVLRALPAGATVDAAALARILDESDPGYRVAVEPPRKPRPLHVPSLTVAVCTHERPALLEQCLASLRELSHSPWGRRISLEILVVDNAPAGDRTAAAVRRFPEVRYVAEPHRGLDFARNRAWREARGDFVAYFDDDVVVDGGWLDGFAEACAEHPDAAAISGPVLPAELVTPVQILFEEYGGFGHRFRKSRFEATHPDDPLYPCSPGPLGSGCNMTIRRSVLAALGGFDEALDTGAPLPGGGDLDMFYRLVRGGHPVVVEPRCLVFHRHRREYRELRHQMWTWGLGAMAFVAKTYRTDPENRPKLRRTVQRWFLHRLLAIVATALGRGSRPVGVEIAQTLGGVVGLCGEYRRSCRRVGRIRAEVARRGVGATQPAPALTPPATTRRSVRSHR